MELDRREQAPLHKEVERSRHAQQVLSQRTRTPRVDLAGQVVRVCFSVQEGRKPKLSMKMSDNHLSALTTYVKTEDFRPWCLELTKVEHKNLSKITREISHTGSHHHDHCSGFKIVVSHSCNNLTHGKSKKKSRNPKLLNELLSAGLDLREDNGINSDELLISMNNNVMHLLRMNDINITLQFIVDHKSGLMLNVESLQAFFTILFSSSKHNASFFKYKKEYKVFRSINNLFGRIPKKELK
ncbi:unnamed protein product [Lupinus luteus]|uniref:Uncharacterized protein n=1 Tax=Lupinus luteus TaxID=3873 RepID=A0AAV1XSY6_LUPLU